MSKDRVQRAQVAEALKQEFEGTLDERVERYLRADHHPMTPDFTFAPASAECIELFRDAHYYGCVALCQAVGEALVRFMCEANSWRPAGSFEENLRTLSRREFIDGEFERAAKRLWNRRHDFHHLNRTVATDRGELEETAFSKIRALAEMERWAFAYTVHHGKIRPTRPQYWPRTDEGHLAAYLRFSP